MKSLVRSLTNGEKSLLRLIFEVTLPYDSMQVSRNDMEWGGSDNSITPGGTPFMAKSVWCADFSSASVSDDDKEPVAQSALRTSR